MEIIEEKVDRRYEMNDCLDTNRLSNLLSHLLYQRARMKRINTWATNEMKAEGALLIKTKTLSRSPFSLPRARILIRKERKGTRAQPEAEDNVTGIHPSLSLYLGWIPGEHYLEQARDPFLNRGSSQII